MRRPCSFRGRLTASRPLVLVGWGLGPAAIHDHRRPQLTMKRASHADAIAAIASAAVLLTPGQAAAATVERIASFGNNPTGIGMYLYTPSSAVSHPPILVGVHACHGKGTDVCASGLRLRQQADKYGFLLVCPSAVSSDGCWDVHSSAVLTHNGGGDASGIISMVNYVVQNRNGDASRVFVAGHSSGGMMTNVLIGSYPDVFKAGAAYAGVPFACFAQGSVDGLGVELVLRKREREQDRPAMGRSRARRLSRVHGRATAHATVARNRRRDRQLPQLRRRDQTVDERARRQRDACHDREQRHPVQLDPDPIRRRQRRRRGRGDSGDRTAAQSGSRSRGRDPLLRPRRFDAGSGWRRGWIAAAAQAWTAASTPPEGAAAVRVELAGPRGERLERADAAAGAAPPARQPPPEVPGRAQQARRVADAGEHPGARARAEEPPEHRQAAAAVAGWVEPPACPRGAATPEPVRAAPLRLAERAATQGRPPARRAVAGNAGSVGADSAGCSCNTVCTLDRNWLSALFLTLALVFRPRCRASWQATTSRDGRATRRRI